MSDEAFPEPRFDVGDRVKILNGQRTGQVAPIVEMFYANVSMTWMYRVAITPDEDSPYYEHELTNDKDEIEEAEEAQA